MMMNPEISVSDVYQTYKPLWWLLVVLFLVGGIVGILTPKLLTDDILVGEFSMPVVIREQNTPYWQEEDDFALLGFVHAWLSNEWHLLTNDHFPDARALVLLKNETFQFLLEQEQPLVDDGRMDKIADELLNNFQKDFFELPGEEVAAVAENTGCLTDASRESMVECIPVTPGISDIIRSDTFEMGDFLWVGERSDVQVSPKYTSGNLLRFLAGSICAEALFFLVLLLDLTNRSMRGRE